MGKVIMSGIVPTLKAPVDGFLASDIAVGSTVKLTENGAAVEYLVVNHGIPSDSSLYDDSCDGVWLLRKDCVIRYRWGYGSQSNSGYGESAIHAYLRDTFYPTFGEVEQATIREVKVPYTGGGRSYDVHSGADGLSCKVFLLSFFEVGFTVTYNFPTDGAKLDYFDSTDGTTASDKRIANTPDVSPYFWWLRNPQASNDMDSTWDVTTIGDADYQYSHHDYGIRPAVIVPKTAVFDKTTMLLKGVA